MSVATAEAATLVRDAHRLLGERTLEFDPLFTMSDNCTHDRKDR
jgi:hypothetical protein